MTCPRSLSFEPMIHTGGIPETVGRSAPGHRQAASQCPQVPGLPANWAVLGSWGPGVVVTPVGHGAGFWGAVCPGRSGQPAPLCLRSCTHSLSPPLLLQVWFHFISVRTAMGTGGGGRKNRGLQTPQKLRTPRFSDLVVDAGCKMVSQLRHPHKQGLGGLSLDSHSPCLKGPHCAPTVCRAPGCGRAFGPAGGD